MTVIPAELVEERLERAQRELDRAVRSVAERLHPTGSLLRGSPGQQLADEASAAVDLMVVGSRGYGPLQRVLLGSVSTSLVHSAPCPVMVVPRTAEFDPSGVGLAGEDQVVASA
jgi:nucleotide-binding universal stress UspA family protein